MAKKILIEAYRPEWQDMYAQEAEHLRPAFGDTIVRVHHIGSTAILGMSAKPIIDILVEVADIEAVDQQNNKLEQLGYEAMGEFGIKARRYFRKENQAGARTHHVHTFEVGSPEVARHLGFRDFMIAHPELAAQYSDLKRRLVAEHQGDAESYINGKGPFIQHIDRLVAQDQK